MGRQSKGPACDGSKQKDGNFIEPSNAGEKVNRKGRAAAPKTSEVQSSSFINNLRPKPRLVFFAVFVVFCGSFCFGHNQCDVKSEKRRDCGFEGITTASCRTKACFFKGAKVSTKRTIKVKQDSDDDLGMTVAGSEKMVVDSISSGGAVSKHNEQLAPDSRDRIQIGDEILQVDSSTKIAGVRKALANKRSASATVPIQVLRPNLPTWLNWIRSPGPKPNKIEKLLSAPGTKHFVLMWTQLSTIALVTWFTSGYPLASLGTYLLLSTAVSFELSRCCHDDRVVGNFPHCYTSRRDSLAEVAENVVQHLRRSSGHILAWDKWASAPKFPR